MNMKKVHHQTSLSKHVILSQALFLLYNKNKKTKSWIFPCHVCKQTMFIIKGENRYELKVCTFCRYMYKSILRGQNLIHPICFGKNFILHDTILKDLSDTYFNLKRFSINCTSQTEKYFQESASCKLLYVNVYWT